MVATDVAPRTSRILSLDVVRGLIMCLMVVDHVRDYFHWAAPLLDPTDPEKSYPLLFFTRLITHLCAPTFVLLTGTGAFLYQQRNGRNATARFLLTRGLWLILLEVVVVRFGWLFDVGFHFFPFQVIWVLGASMVLLAGAVYLPRAAVLLISLLLIVGHNLLDEVSFGAGSLLAILWAFLHGAQQPIVLWPDHLLFIRYPLLPWPGVLGLGYCLGSLYQANYPLSLRRSMLTRLGVACLGLFVLLRGLGWYGDSVSFQHYADFSQRVMSFFEVSKYPPSLHFLLLTLGTALLLLRAAEQWHGRLADWLRVFGAVPLFFYLLHIYFIHLLQTIAIWIWVPNFKGWGLFDPPPQILQPMWVVYLIWLGVLLVLYPVCRWYGSYKATHPGNAFLKYL